MKDPRRNKTPVASAAETLLERRRFLTGVASGGLLLGLPPLLASCGGGGEESDLRSASVPSANVVGGAEPRETRTLFFNLAHVADSDGRHFLVVHGQRLPMTPVAQSPSVLASARIDNAFLRAVPDDQITHHVEDVPLATKICPLLYTTCDEDTATGNWSMTGIAQLLPGESAGTAFAKLRAVTPSGPLPRSAKRIFYGHPAATTARDIEEEHALVDPVDHARTLVTLAPDLLCVDPAGAHYISTQHVGNLFNLTSQLKMLGKATANGGWATLRPVVDAQGTPHRNAQGLIQYYPDFDPTIDSLLANQVAISTSSAKDDVTLGRDVTDVPAPTTAPDASFAGSIWQRRDGQTAVRRTASATADSNGSAYAFAAPSNQYGLQLSEPVITTLSDGRKQISVQYLNWFLRFLGVYAQFTDPNGNLISVASLSGSTFPGRTLDSAALDKTYSAFLGVIPPAYTVAGIPIYAAPNTQTIAIPLGASKLTFQLAGIGFNGNWNDPEELTLVGGLLTGFVNWALVAMAMACGVSTVDALVKAVASIAAQTVNEVVAGVGAGISWKSEPSAAAIGVFCGKLLQAIVAGVTVPGLGEITVKIAEFFVAKEVIEEVPVLGTVCRVVAGIIGGISLAESLVEVGISPPIYSFDLTLTRNVIFTLRPDKNNSRFPDVPNGYVLYYIVTLTFDSGIPHVKDPVDIPDTAVAGIPVSFPSVPRGGTLTISVGVYARKTGSTARSGNDWLAGQATVGPLPNLDDTPIGDIAIMQTRINIVASTVYVHKRRTQLDANGRHQWVETSTPPSIQPFSSSGTAGALSALRAITVRQGTSQPVEPGYVGYAWRAYSSGLVGCGAKAPGQFDQVASLNTDPDNAESGRLQSACGLQGGSDFGVSIAYSLLGKRTNVYFDSATGHLRVVDLGPVPVISPSGGGTSLGVLQLDSTQLLLHPSGHVVSLNNEFSKFEALRLPNAPVDDVTASRSLKALVMSGPGSRPGLMRQPIAAAIAADGTILVLEDSTGNNRISAFDLTGNPIKYFTQQKNPNFLQLDSTEGATYLDLAIEFSGYLYVLAQSANGSIRLDIYQPNQVGTRPFCSTLNVNAGRIAVDYWRALYALNFEVLTLNGAVPALTEPSISQWLPPIPS